MVTKRIVVEGFRAFRNKVEVPLNTITIVTGRNNVGKSSLLEALAIGCSLAKGFRDVLDRDVIEYIMGSKDLSKRMLVNNNVDYAVISIESTKKVEFKIHKPPFTKLMGLEELMEHKYIEVLNDYATKLGEYTYGVELKEIPVELQKIRVIGGEIIRDETLAFLYKIFTVILRLNHDQLHGKDIKNVIEDLCLTVAVERDDMATCTSRIGHRVERLLSAYSNFIHNIIKFYIENFIDLIIEYRGKENTRCIRIECINQGYEHLISRICKKSKMYIDSVIKELNNVIIPLASVSRIRTLEIDIRRLRLIGVLDRMLKAFIEFVVGRVREVVDRINSELQSYPPKVDQLDVLFLTHRSMWRFSDLDALLDKVYELKQKPLLIRLLRVVGVEDIWRSRDGKLYVTIDDENIPIQALGDGTISLLRLVALHSLIDKGVVIVEEPETSMHPGYIALYAKILVDYVTQSRYRQVVLTTHSIELIDQVMEYLRRANALDKVSIVLLSRLNGHVEVHPYKGDEAYEYRRKIYEDLRGI